MSLDLTKPVRYCIPDLGGEKRFTEAKYLGGLPDNAGSLIHAFAYRDNVGEWRSTLTYQGTTRYCAFENVPERKETWINLYPGDMQIYPQRTKKDADGVANKSSKSRVAAIKVVWEGDVPISVELIKE